MSWSGRRQFFYATVVILFVLIFGFLILYPYFNEAPSCMDGRQNGDESGVDCGGSCKIACTEEVDKISLVWSRAFEVVPGRYNAVAYLENKNSTAAVYKIKYRFRFADKDNIYIGKREGETFIPPLGRFAIFEPAIGIGNSIPVFTTFEFLEDPIWVQVPKEKVDQVKISIRDIRLEIDSISSKLSALLTNNSLFFIPELQVISILYDKKGNAINASSTYLDLLKGEETTNINFSWPKKISEEIVEKEIIPMFNIFLTKLK